MAYNLGDKVIINNENDAYFGEIATIVTLKGEKLKEGGGRFSLFLYDYEVKIDSIDEIPNHEDIQECYQLYDERDLKPSHSINEKNIYFAKMNPNAIIPSKREEDGAFDIYACFEENYVIINPHETKMIPTGLASAFSSDYVAILKERGSNGSKGIGQRAGVVDSGYRGEWFVPLTNHNEKPAIIIKKDELEKSQLEDDYIIYPYEKGICQCIMVEVPKLKIQEVSYEQLMNFKSERGTGCLGSSNK